MYKKIIDLNLQKEISTLVGMSIIVVVAVIALGAVFGVKYYIEVNNALLDNKSIIVGGDKDEHGCIGSAGYTWCEVKNKCLRVWEEGCETTTTDPTADWETYTNNIWGYSISYPKDWSVEEGHVYINSQKDHVIFRKPTSVSGVPGDFWFGILSSSSVDSFETDIGCGKIQNTKIGTYEAKMKECPKDGQSGPSLSYLIENNGVKYELYILWYSQRDNIISNEILSTFKFTTPAVITTLRLWPDINSFNLVNKTFQAKGMGDSANIVKNIKVYTNNSTKFLSKDMATSMNNFQDMYIMMRDWVGFEWWFNVKGTYQSDGSFLASDISIAGQ